MIIKTDKGRQVNADWAWAPVGDNDDLMIEYVDERSMAQIAEDWEGCERINRVSDEEGNVQYEGYVRIRSIVRRRGGVVQLTLMQA